MNNCKQCNIEFIPTRKDNLYCSNKCKSNAAYYKRKHTTSYKINQSKSHKKRFRIQVYKRFGINEINYLNNNITTPIDIYISNNSIGK